jgi:hypothetical protein
MVVVVTQTGSGQVGQQEEVVVMLCTQLQLWVAPIM